MEELQKSSNLHPSLVSCPDVHIMEHHNDAYRIWKSQGIKKRTLIHLDGHIDFIWFAEEDPLTLLHSKDAAGFDSHFNKTLYWNTGFQAPDSFVTLANFIYPAIRDGMVKTFFWVVPDPVWDDKKERGVIEKIFLKLRSMNPQETGSVSVYPDKIQTSFLGAHVTALKLKSMPEISEECLLDIDTDYFITRKLSGQSPYFIDCDSNPWITPQELSCHLKARFPVFSLATIAYSVEGGYTPLRYKYLGDAMKACFTGQGCDKSLAADNFEKYLGLKKGLYFKEALEYLKKAASLDNAYLSLYNNDALRFFEQKRYRSAEQELNMALSIFPDFIPYRLLLARVLELTKRLDKAVEQCLAIVDKDPDCSGAWAILSCLYYRKKDFLKSKECFERASGQNCRDLDLLDIGARLCGVSGDLRGSVKYLQKMALLNPSSIYLLLRLALGCLRLGNFFKMREKLNLAFKQILVRLCG